MKGMERTTAAATACNAGAGQDRDGQRDELRRCLHGMIDKIEDVSTLRKLYRDANDAYVKG